MLVTDRISKSFGGLKALDDVTLNVEQGEIVALIGPNGAGKTTLFSVVSGFLPADEGRVTFDGTDITGLPPHRICRMGLARTFQLAKPFSGLSVRQNIAVGAYLHLAKREALAKADEVASLLQLAKVLDQKAAGLSVALRKRLELARALATGPRMLLLDEVFGGLNPTEIKSILPVMRQIRDTGVTIVLIEHVMQAVMQLSDRIVVLNNGRVISAGAPATVAADPVVVEAYLGTGAAAIAAQETSHA
jgi:branched-chain amino acid transport system ATP-binding protein